jgi:hypothetical protein
MGDIFDQLAANGNNPSTVQQGQAPQQATPQPQRGDIFDRLAANGNDDAALASGSSAQPGLLDRANQWAASNPAEDRLTRVEKSLARLGLAIPNLAVTLAAPPKDNVEAAISTFDPTGAGVAVKRLIYDPSEHAWQHINDMAQKQRDAVELKRQTGEISDDRAKEITQHINRFETAGKALATIPFLGPFGLAEGEQAAKGDVAGTLTDVGAMAVLPEVIRGVNALRSGAGAAGAAEGAELAEGAEGTSPVEAQVSKAVDESGIAEGTPASEPPSDADIQPGLQAGIRGVASDVADEAEVQPAQAQSVRDVYESLGDQVLQQAKDSFKLIDDATGGRFTNVQNALKNVELKLRDVAGTDDALEERLAEKKAFLESSLDDVFDMAKKEGVDPAVADEARVAWKQGSALQDVSTQVRASTAGRAGVGRGVETIDPDKLAPRLHKLYDSGRLQEALGEDRAGAVIEHTENAQAAMQEIKNFEPSTATGKSALEGLVRKNTFGKSKMLKLGKVQGVTDWNGVVKDFENLGPENQVKAFGNDVARVRTYIGRQALRQNALSLLKKGAAIGVGGAVGAVGYEAVK